ncbi:uncharacterized protein BX663DRAFT_500855 [Cokeromyces recurvatus]|uniref:uncharacterized protein n=1 Tax=Cokeromyces recurvatus TaxID=90255 RepID=UPI0022205A03|nr:uncharacterized protein BX663DRAFT_500855 [Cokeromyces recurvatus]KAI7905774.1 hypothetical protein BX663DRAFT_500855 [Cokeromyces recurvatus]
MALFAPLIISIPIGYFTWTKVFDIVDNGVYQITQSNAFDEVKQQLKKPPISFAAATIGTVTSIGVLGKLAFTANTRHRLFFAKAPANSNIRIETLKLGIELLIRSSIVFYGSAIGGAVTGRIISKS